MNHPRAQHGPASGGHDPNRFKVRTEKNDQQMIAFILAIVVLASAFILLPWARALRSSKRPASGFAKMSRAIRGLLIRPMRGLPSIGHGTLVAMYLLINACIAFTNTDPALTPISNYGSRMGWMAIANMVVVVILALKNTPVAVISPWSYERLNVLHQVAGCATIVFVILHACLYSVNFTSLGMGVRLLERDNIFGMVAALSFLLLGFGGMVIRRWWYELFYYLHILFWLVALTMTGLHQPEVVKKVVYVVPVAGGIWLLDRAIRLARLAAYSKGNYVTLTPLSNGATRVTLEKAPLGARPGKHCYLWIPQIRPTEAHPFTIVATSPVEFVISSYDGFTSSLHSHAKNNPGGKLRASVDGPYGTNPDPRKFDKTVLVAGGSGVTFTLGIAQDMLSKMSPSETKEIVFIWIVRQKAYLSWFAEQLNQLQHDNRVKVQLYVTRETLEQAVNSPTLLSTPNLEKSSSMAGDPEKEVGEGPSRPQVWRSRTVSSGKASTASVSDLASPIDGIESEIHNLPVNYERPKMAELVERAISETSHDQKVLVMACGPKTLSKQVRETTARQITAGGPSVELHCEQFGW